MRNQEWQSKAFTAIGSLNVIARVFFVLCFSFSAGWKHFWDAEVRWRVWCFLVVGQFPLFKWWQKEFCVFKQLPSVILFFGYFWFLFLRLPTSISASIHYPLTSSNPLTVWIHPIETKGRNSSQVNSSASMPRWKSCCCCSFPPICYGCDTYDYANSSIADECYVSHIFPKCQ